MNEFKREIEISKSFGTILIVFLFGFIPYGIIRGFDKNNGLHPDIYIFLTLIFIMSISVSPLIIVKMNKQINKECVDLMELIFSKDVNAYCLKSEASLTNLKRMSPLKE